MAKKRTSAPKQLPDFTAIKREHLKEHIEQVAKFTPMRLRIAREAGGLTQSQISRAVKVSRGRWSQYEKGQRTLNWQVAAMVSVVCDIDTRYILYGYIDDRELLARVSEVKARIESQDGVPVMDGLHLWFGPTVDN